ncbi:hypothetical protein EsH8_III_000788 [Colletotrichum jinshuiense]
MSVSRSGYLAPPGLISYNMAFREFKNTPTTEFGGHGDPDRGLRTVPDKWHTQQTTGSRPTRRKHFRAVGVSRPNNSYEIFLCGGMGTQTSISSDEVLRPGPPCLPSSPGRPGRPPVGRDHACVVAGGRPDVLHPGGADGNLCSPKSPTDWGHWRPRLDVFDMTQMRWADGYDAQAPTHGSPDVVKQWYSQGGLEYHSWSSNEAKVLFAEIQNSEAQESQGSHTPVGATVGGGVGGVAGLALAVAVAVGLAVLLMRRKRHAAAPQQ